MRTSKVQSNANEMKTIQIAGSCHGVGTTHFCISLAYKLNSLGYRVAVLEENPADEFNEIAENLECHQRGLFFTYKNVDYYPYQKNRNLMAVRSSGYDYLIVDNGLYKDCDKDFFAMSNLNVIVSSSRYWNFYHLSLNILEVESQDVFSSYTYVFPFAHDNKSMRKEIVEAMGDISSIIFTPYSENPFEDYGTINVSELLGIDDSEEKNRSKLFFGLGKNKKGEKAEKNTANEAEIEYEEGNEIEADKISVAELGKLATQAVMEMSNPSYSSKQQSYPIISQAVSQGFSSSQSKSDYQKEIQPHKEEVKPVDDTLIKMLAESSRFMFRAKSSSLLDEINEGSFVRDMLSIQMASTIDTLRKNCGYEYSESDSKVYININGKMSEYEKDIFGKKRGL